MGPLATICQPELGTMGAQQRLSRGHCTWSSPPSSTVTGTIQDGPHRVHLSGQPQPSKVDGWIMTVTQEQALRGPSPRLTPLGMRRVSLCLSPVNNSSQQQCSLENRAGEATGPFNHTMCQLPKSKPADDRPAVPRKQPNKNAQCTFRQKQMPLLLSTLFDSPRGCPWHHLAVSNLLVLELPTPYIPRMRQDQKWFLLGPNVLELMQSFFDVIILRSVAFFHACNQHDSRRQKFSSCFGCSPNPSLSLCFWFCSHFTLFLCTVLGLLISTLSF